jgi:hypothetical protein
MTGQTFTWTWTWTWTWTVSGPTMVDLSFAMLAAVSQETR